VSQLADRIRVRARAISSFVGLSLVINLQYVAALLYGVLVARLLGPADLGRMRVINAVLGIAVAIAGLRMDQGIPRFVALYHDDLQRRDDYVRAGTRLSMATGLLTVVVLMLLASHIPGVAEVSAEQLVLVLALTIPFQVFISNTDQFYMGTGIVRAQIVLVLAATSQYVWLVLATQLSGFDGWFYAKLVLPLVFAGVLMWVHRDWFSRPRGTVIYGELARFSWPLWIAGICDVTVISVDALIIGAVVSDPKAVGFYGIASLFFVSCQQMFKPLQRHFFPRLAGARLKPVYIQVLRNYAIAMAVVSGILAAGGWFVAPLFVKPVFGEAFAPAEVLVGTISLAILARAVALLVRTIMQLHGETKAAMVVTIAGAVGNTLMNVFLIRQMGVIGAVYATIGTQAAIALGCLAYSLRIGVFTRLVERKG
jgi:O-antigen/teichoic acid export membrane protein